MPYARVWSNSNIPGSTNANQIDEEFRASKVDIQERLDDVLVTDITLDPLVLQDAVSGKTVGKVMVIPHTSFVQLDGGGGTDIEEFYTRARKDTSTLVASLILPPGAVLKLVEYLINGISAGTNLQCYHISFTAPAKTIVYNLSPGETLGIHTESSGTLAHTILGTSFYYISIDSTGANTSEEAFRLYGVRVTYDVANHQQTL